MLQLQKENSLTNKKNYGTDQQHARYGAGKIKAKDYDTWNESRKLEAFYAREYKNKTFGLNKAQKR